MKAFILGEKSEQSQTYTDKGERIPTTFIKTLSCHLVDIKNTTANGYFAVKLGFYETKNIKKTIRGELQKAGIKTPLRFLREIRVDVKDVQPTLIEENNKKGLTIGESKIFIGDAVNPTMFFKKGELVQVSGISKGKGFQGVVKRHHFKGGPRTHGQSLGERAPGSIGQTTTPGRVYRGKRMAGRMGGDRVTLKNLEIIKVENDGLLIKGLVPGPRTGLLEVLTR
ncbi:MAG: 50S ribosomal protein L3 [bacterium]|nr:50S ribosomal protein L3 [bacterium]